MDKPGVSDVFSRMNIQAIGPTASAYPVCCFTPSPLAWLPPQDVRQTLYCWMVPTMQVLIIWSWQTGWLPHLRVRSALRNISVLFQLWMQSTCALPPSASHWWRLETALYESFSTAHPQPRWGLTPGAHSDESSAQGNRRQVKLYSPFPCDRNAKKNLPWSVDSAPEVMSALPQPANNRNGNKSLRVMTSTPRAHAGWQPNVPARVTPTPPQQSFDVGTINKLGHIRKQGLAERPRGKQKPRRNSFFLAAHALYWTEKHATRYLPGG